MIRCFAAIPLTPTLRQAVTELRRELAPRLPEVRWVRPETLHLTLRFFGDVTEESLEKIGDIMLSVGRQHLPFSVVLQGLGAFPAPTRARIFWLGLHAAEPLSLLYRDLEAGWSTAGFAPEPRPFTPHLTLGRHRGRGLRAGPVLADYTDWPAGRLPVDRIILYESRLLPGGAEHRPRRIVPLGADAGGPAPAGRDFASPKPNHSTGGNNPDG